MAADALHMQQNGTISVKFLPKAQRWPRYQMA